MKQKKAFPAFMNRSIIHNEITGMTYRILLADLLSFYISLGDMPTDSSCGWVQWHTPVFLATWEGQVGKLLERRNPGLQ